MVTRDVRCPRCGKAVVGTTAMWEQRQPSPDELMRRCLEHGTPPWNVPDSPMNGGGTNSDGYAFIQRYRPIALAPAAIVVAFLLIGRTPRPIAVPLVLVLVGIAAIAGRRLLKARQQRGPDRR